MTFANVYQDIKPKKINKKMYRSAMRSIWSKKVEEGSLLLVDDLQINEPVKSSQIKEILANLGMERGLIVISETNEGLLKASRNLKQYKVQNLNSIDPSALIQAEKVLLTSSALDKLTEVLSK